MQALYKELKESGDLSTMFPGLTGDWEKDERSFTRQYESNEELLSEDPLELDDDDEDIY